MNTPTSPSADNAAIATEEETLDPEILEIFVEEGHGEVANIGKHLSVWRTNLADYEAYIAIRRSFHTLKGDCRLVGQMELGEFAWSFEQLMNCILDNKFKPDEAIVAAVTDAHQVFDRVFQDFAGFDIHDPALVKLVKRAEALISGEPTEAEEVVEAAKEPAVEPVFIEERAVDESVYEAPDRPSRSRIVLWILVVVLAAVIAAYYYLN